jgi:hypothetical protein
MTTTTERTSAQLFADARRARTLRWLLKLTKAHDLPMPRDIQFGEMVHSGKTLRYLTLSLDENVDLTGWAGAIDAATIEEDQVESDTHQWIHVCANTAWREGSRVDWHHIQVSTRRHYRPIGLESGWRPS